MKKLFAIFAAALIAFGMSSCKGGQNEPEQGGGSEQGGGFEQVVYGEIHINAYYDNNPYKPRIVVKFEPDNKEAYYFWTYRKASEVAGKSDEQLVAEFEANIYSTDYLFQGNESDEKLDPSKTEYIIYAMYVGADLKKPAGTALFKQSVTVN